MRNNDLSAMLIVAVLAAFTGTATYAQQTAPQSTPQVQDVPVTPEGKPPPAEITPNHPLKGPETTGAAPRSSTLGRADAKPSRDDDKRDREHER
jgi:hypothetical protein